MLGPLANISCFVAVFLICASCLEAQAEKTHPFCRVHSYRCNLKAPEVSELHAPISATSDDSTRGCAQYTVGLANSVPKPKRTSTCVVLILKYTYINHMIFSEYLTSRGD